MPAAFIGGGLGVFIVRGFALDDVAILFAGAVPVAALASAAELGPGAPRRPSHESRMKREGTPNL